MKSLAVVLALTMASPGGAEADLGNTRFEAFAVDLKRSTPRLIRDGDRVIHRVGSSCYMWRLSFSPTEQPVELRETLTLPGRAPSWGANPSTTVAPNMSSAETMVSADGRTGHASNQWCIAAGDPQGLYRFDVHSADKLVGSVKFYLKKNW